MAIKCTHCGGNMKYNIKEEQLKCEYCDECMEIGEVIIDSDTKQINEEDYGCEKEIKTSLFQCSECGATVRSFEEETTIYCPYCGKQTFLKGKENSIKPKYIIPFEKDKNDIKDYYSKFIEKKKFVPKELKNPDFIEEFRGIYIPHWSLSYKLKNEVIFDGFKKYTSGGYDYYETYDVHINTYKPIKDIAFDASKAFADSIASEIAPFKTDEAKKFDEGYIAGFYADKETVQSETYDEIAKEIATEKIKQSIEESKTGQRKMHILKNKNKIEYNKTNTDLMYFPVWFLTYRNQDRVSYFVVNGQTGKTAIDLPVDKKEFFKTAGLLSIILSILFVFLFSTILYSVTATIISYFSLVALLISSFILYKETKMIYEKDNHLTTLTNKKRTKTTNKATTKKTITKATTLIILLFFVLPIFIVIEGMFPNGSGTTKPTIATVIFAVPLIALQINLHNKIKKVSIKNEKMLSMVSIFIIIASIVLYIISSPNDWFYYGISIASAIGIILNSLGCISDFDYLTSRPIPNFFEREGANHGE